MVLIPTCPRAPCDGAFEGRSHNVQGGREGHQRTQKDGEGRRAQRHERTAERQTEGERWPASQLLPWAGEPFSTEGAPVTHRQASCPGFGTLLSTFCSSPQGPALSAVAIQRCPLPGAALQRFGVEMGPSASNVLISDQHPVSPQQSTAAGASSGHKARAVRPGGVGQAPRPGGEGT